MSEPKFHKTRIEVTVLSEEPINPHINDLADLAELAQEMDQGRYAGTCEVVDTETLDGKRMVNALYDVGGEPRLFFLDDDGNLTGTQEES